jgi:hypothetical protein
MWSVVEPELAVICANLAVMHPIFARYIFPLVSRSGSRLSTTFASSHAAREDPDRPKGASQDGIFTGTGILEDFELNSYHGTSEGGMDIESARSQPHGGGHGG